MGVSLLISLSYYILENKARNLAKNLAPLGPFVLFAPKCAKFFQNFENFRKIEKNAF